MPQIGTRASLAFLTISLFFATTSFALFDTAGGGNSQSSSPSPVLSPSEFTSRVNTLKQQTKDNLAQEVKKTLASKAPGASHGANPTPVTSTTSSAPSPTLTSSPTPPAQHQPYTGFGGTGNGKQPNAPASGNNNSGWNINY